MATASARPRWKRAARVRLRRLLSRLDRLAPAWLAWLPSWGTSLLLHGVLLVILATAAFVTTREREAPPDFDSSISLADSDFDSLAPADRSGDPFTDAKTDQTPSIALNSADSGISQPALAANLSFAPNLTRMDSTAPGRSGELGEMSQTIRSHNEDTTAPFAGRTGPNKAQLIRREGGTTASERAVQDGLQWLMRHQRKDGSWALDVSPQCQVAPGCPGQSNSFSDTAATGLGLLPFLAAGHIHTEPSRYQDVVQRGVDWLIANQQKSGELYLGGDHNGEFYSHAIATMALCEAYGLSKDARLKGPAQRAIDFIVMSQNKEDGGWRYTPGMPGDTSVFGWQMFALRSAKLGGLDVPKNVIRGCSHYLDEAAIDRTRTTYGYLPGRPIMTPTMTAEALLCRQYLGWPREHPAMVKGVAGVWSDLQGSSERNIYYWYYATQLLHNMQNTAWKKWNPKVRDGLVSTQVISKGCDHGSWSPYEPQPDRWGANAGRLYQTSMSILTLEVYYRWLPLYRTPDEKKEAEKPEVVERKVAP